MNLEPLVGAAAGTALFGNPLGPVQLAGGAAIVAGIVLSSLQVIRSGRRRQPQARLVVAGPLPEPDRDSYPLFRHMDDDTGPAKAA